MLLKNMGLCLQFVSLMIIMRGQGTPKPSSLLGSGPDMLKSARFSVAKATLEIALSVSPSIS